MVVTSEYYDPSTKMIHIHRSGDMSSIPAGQTESMNLGLADTSFEDTKFKIKSITYKLLIYPTNTGSFDVAAFNASNDCNGEYIFGVGNTTENFDSFTDLVQFRATSAWPVDTSMWFSTVGRVFTATKVWKPRKLALSHEQKAFLVAFNDFGSSRSPQSYGSIYIRGIRL